MKLIFLSGSFRRGGYERRLSYYIDWLSLHRPQIDFSLLCQSLNGEYRPNIQKKKIYRWWSYYLKKLRLTYIEQLYTYILVKFISRRQIVTLVIGHQSILNSIAKNRFIINDTKVRLVFNVINNLEFSPYKIETYRNLRICDKIIVNSIENKKWLLDNKGLEGHYIPNYFPSNISRKSQKSFDPNSLKIVSCGSLDSQKNFSDLICAVAMLQNKYPNIGLTIYGNGAEKPTLMRSALDLKLDNFSIISNQDFRSFVSNYDIFVCSSRYEGYPNALLEAQVARLPAISYDIAYGPNEIIRNKFSGILVVDNQPTALATGLDEMIDNLEHYLSNVEAHAEFLENKHSNTNSHVPLTKLYLS